MSADARLSPEERAGVGQAWLEAGLGEHASVAAFARFVLHLLSLGAPAHLVREAIRAMDDEVEHARFCFGIAKRFTGMSAGPGPLNLKAVYAEPDDPESILRAAILEGCIAETISARCAAEALTRLQDRSIQIPLSRIVEDESRHAELSWNFVRWMLEVHPDLASVAADCFDGALATPPAAEGDPGDGQFAVIEQFGHISHATRVQVVQRVVENEIKPLRDAMFQRATVSI